MKQAIFSGVVFVLLAGCGGSTGDNEPKGHGEMTATTGVDADGNVILSGVKFKSARHVYFPSTNRSRISLRSDMWYVMITYPGDAPIVDNTMGGLVEVTVIRQFPVHMALPDDRWQANGSLVSGGGVNVDVGSSLYAAKVNDRTTGTVDGQLVQLEGDGPNPFVISALSFVAIRKWR